MATMTAYMDHAATTPLRPEALAAMLGPLTEHFGNPSGAHSISRDARLLLDDARDRVAEALGAEPGEVVFTGGGTEADNLAVVGAHARRGGRVLCSATEHHAVLHACRTVGGAEVVVDGDGTIDLDALAAALGPDVTLVSVMMVNNEVGTIAPLDSVVALTRRLAPDALVHTDAVQAFPWLDVAALASDVDLVSVSAHKFGGPKGVGALVVRGGAELRPVLHGGGQERDRRSGTHNVAGIAGMAAAASSTVAARAEAVGRVSRLRDLLADELLCRVPDASETVSRRLKVAGSCHMRFAGVESEALLVLLDESGVCASAGSACASGALEPSHVLAAMGMSSADASSSVRFSLGHDSTPGDVDAVLDVVPKAVAQLRR